MTTHDTIKQLREMEQTAAMEVPFTNDVFVIHDHDDDVIADFNCTFEADFYTKMRNNADLLLSIAEAFRPGDAKMLRDLVIFFSEMEKGGIPSDEIMVHLWNNHQSMKECMVRLQAAAEKLE